MPGSARQDKPDRLVFLAHGQAKWEPVRGKIMRQINK
jgi:hypothetical protein